MATMTEPKVDKKTLVHYLVEGGVAIIELDDPPANTYTHEMMRQLDDAILQVRFDDTAHVLVLRGHGEKFFSAGANIAYLNSITPRYKYFFCRLAKENAGKIGLPEVNLGVLPGTGGTQRLARIVGKTRAIEMMVKGETFSFDKAKELGLINEVFPADDYWEQVMLYAKQFCPPHKASKAVGLIKRSVQSGAEIPFESGLTLERELQQQLFQSDDAKEGIAAYVEKRVAEFKGRCRPRAPASSPRSGASSPRASAVPCSTVSPTCSSSTPRRSPMSRRRTTASRCSSRRSTSPWRSRRSATTPAGPTSSPATRF